MNKKCFFFTVAIASLILLYIFIKDSYYYKIEKIVRIRNDKNFEIYEYNKDIIADKETAINVAKAILIPIYGKGLLKNCYLDGWLERDSIWHIGIAGDVNVLYSGPHLRMLKKNGEVLSIANEK